MYTLMNKNDKIVDFEIVGEGIVQCCNIIKEYREIPSWITSLNAWIDNRSAEKHRKHVKDILEQCNANDKVGFIALTHCLSLTDTLWVKHDCEDITWDICNLYDNKFNEVISKLSFDGNGLFGVQMSVTSPELTTDGSYDKCWIDDGGSIYLIKGGILGFSNTGREPYSEVLASSIFEELCDGVHYDLYKYNGRPVSKCALFTSQEYGYKSYAEIYGSKASLVDLIEVYDKLGSLDVFKGMIVADCVTINSDRHFGNFGFAVNNDTFELVGLNKPFDYNLALFPYADWYNGFSDMEAYQKECRPVIGTTYDETAKALLTPHIRAQLINLKDLVLTIECDEVFTKSRLDIVNRFKNIQIDRILGNRRQFNFTDLKDEEGNRLAKLFEQAQGNKRG